jgi:hypothetical protein
MTVGPQQGGARQGVQGKGYVQRTDLMQGPRVPAQPQGRGREPQRPRGVVTPDDLPNLRDPSGDARPLTDGLPTGPGAGPDALPREPDLSQDMTMATLELLYRHTGSDYLLRLMHKHRGLQVGMRAKR